MHARALTYTPTPFFFLSSLHYKEDGEEHLQFSNLYDSALFNKRALFPVRRNTQTCPYVRKRTHTQSCGRCQALVSCCKLTYVIYSGPVAVSFVALEGF